MFKVIDMSVKINKIQILHSINFHVDEGEIVSIIGANGAGKSTVLNTIAGLYAPFEGEVLLDNERISRLSAHSVIKKGLSLVPEGRQIFPGHTVKENLELGAYIHYYRNKKDVSKNVTKILDMFPALKKHYDNLGGNLSGGEQQMLAIGRALMSNPRIILLDEPSMGLAPRIVDEILEILLKIKNELGTMVILVEQNITSALRVADRVYVLDQGRIVLSGTNEEIRDNPEVKSTYLGIST